MLYVYTHKMDIPYPWISLKLFYLISEYPRMFAQIPIDIRLRSIDTYNSSGDLDALGTPNRILQVAQMT